LFQICSEIVLEMFFPKNLNRKGAFSGVKG